MKIACAGCGIGTDDDGVCHTPECKNYAKTLDPATSSPMVKTDDATATVSAIKTKVHLHVVNDDKPPVAGLGVKDILDAINQGRPHSRVPELPENFTFADHPKSVNEARIERDESITADKWTPREALVRALRDIDNGSLEATKAIIIIASDEVVTAFMAAGTSSVPEAVGLMEVAKFSFISFPRG